MRALAAILALALLGACARPPSTAGTPPERALAGLWVPSPPAVIAAMLELAAGSKSDVLVQGYAPVLTAYKVK